MSAIYDPYSASSRTGLFSVPNTGMTAPEAGLASNPASVHSAVGSILSPKNPLFWFGVVLGGTLGLIAVSGAIRVGPVKAGGQIGKP